jgi:hypothetical protein
MLNWLLLCCLLQPIDHRTLWQGWDVDANRVRWQCKEDGKKWIVTKGGRPMGTYTARRTGEFVELQSASGMWLRVYGDKLMMNGKGWIVIAKGQWNR